jgi:F-type H+-transporting ATPase subunit b
LAHFLLRPVVNAIAARQKAAGQLLADATAAKAAAEGEREKAAAETAALAAHRSEALKAAEAEAAAAKAALLAEAQAEAETEAARRTEALAAEDRAGQLAVDIATKLLDRLPREARVAAFLDGIATGLAKLPEGTRASIGANGASVRLTAARAVTPEEVEACRKALAGVLGHPVSVEVSVELAPQAETVGRVERVGDGIALVSGCQTPA